MACQKCYKQINEILTNLSFERLAFTEIVNISNVLHYFCEFQFRPRFTLKVAPNNAESWRARNATTTDAILIILSFERLGFSEILDINKLSYYFL